jgi:hypothetical protein
MRELLVRGKNTIDPEVIDSGGRSVGDSPVKRDFTFYRRVGRYTSSFFKCNICINFELPNSDNGKYF